MEDPQNKVAADPMPHHHDVARLYPRISVLKAVTFSGFTVFGIGMIWIITRILTEYASQSIALAGLLHFSMDRIVLAVLNSDIQKKKFRSKKPFKRMIFCYVLSILMCRSICPLLLHSQKKRFHVLKQVWTLLRCTLISCFGTYIVGMPFLPAGIGYTSKCMSNDLHLVHCKAFSLSSKVRASAFPLLRNPYQLFFSRLFAAFELGFPESTKIASFRRFLGPTLASRLSRVTTTTIFAGIVLGALYNWRNPAVWILWSISMFVESLISSTQSEIDPFIVSPFPAFDFHAFLLRAVAYALLSVFFLPGLEGILIYLAVFVGNAWAGALIQSNLIDHLLDPLCRLGSHLSASKQVRLIHRCILEDILLADDASRSPPHTEEPQGFIKFEIDLYTTISEQYDRALNRPSKLAEDELTCDLMKLAALKVVAQADSIFEDKAMPPQILRSVCVFLGCLGRTLSACQKSAEEKLIQWRLPPTFFLAVRYGLEGLRLHLAKQSFDFIVFTPVSLNAIRCLVEGIEDFKRHDPSSTPHLDEIKTLCEATANDIIRDANKFGATGIRTDVYQDQMTKVWIASLRPMIKQ